MIDSNNIEDLPEGWKNVLKIPVDTEDESGRRWQKATNNLFQYEREGEIEGNEEGDEEDVEEQGKIKRVLIFTTNTYEGIRRVRWKSICGWNFFRDSEALEADICTQH